MQTDFDIVVIGGGINGCGIARDAAGRGLKTLLLESGDLACATSSASTKLIHGGLRYLEYYEFGLVHKALHERSVLLKLAPHIIWPLTFILPHQPHLRPRWLLRMGLYIYDLLAGLNNPLPRSRAVKFSGAPLQPHLTHGFSYSDCWVEDSRLVVLNAMAAHELGATILTHTPCTQITQRDGYWQVTTPDHIVTTRSIVNAGGPWVDDILGLSPLKSDRAVKLVKGSHIITKKLYDGEHAYILQTQDRRIVFAIPYEQNFTLIGTTDVPYVGNPYAVQIDETEIAYLLAQANASFQHQLTTADIVHSYSGVRPLLDDGATDAKSVTRDYNLVWHAAAAPAVSVYGGKITTYRKLAAELVGRLSKDLGNTKPDWTHAKPLPGGDIENFEAWYATLAKQYPFLPPALLRRYARAYGTRMSVLLGQAKSLTELGQYFGDDVYQAEIDYLRTYEFAKSANAILWRRTKLGLHISDTTKNNVINFLAGVA